MYSYNIEKKTEGILYLAKTISKRLNIKYITKETLYISSATLGESPLHDALLKSQFTHEQILENSTFLLNLINLSLFTANNNSVNVLINDSIYNVSTDVYYLLSNAEELAKKNKDKKIMAKDIISTLASNFPNLFLLLQTDISKYDLNYISQLLLPPTVDSEEKPKDDLSNQTESDDEIEKLRNKSVFSRTSETSIILPSEVSSFLTVMNHNYSPDEEVCEICGREKETQQLLRVLMKMNKKNAVLVGEPGVGKSALVDKLAWMITTKHCPEKFKNSLVLSLDMTSIIAGTRYRGEAEERFEQLKNFLLNHPEAILFIDEIHLLLGAGACREGELDLANSLKPLLARTDVQIVGATTNKEYNEYFSKDAALKRRFEKITIKEPLLKDVYQMVKVKVKKLESYHNVKIDKEVVDFIISNACCYRSETHNPDRTLDLVDMAMVNTEVSGRTQVTKKDVMSIFEENQKLYDNLDPNEKSATAYHEAGHFIVSHFAPRLKGKEIAAISIIPGENHLGINVFEDNPLTIPTNDIDYYTQSIALLLAGRYAEQMHSNRLTGGAGNDLEKANNIALHVAKSFALLDKDNDYTIYQGDDLLYSEKIKIKNHKETLLKDSKKYALNLLNTYHNYLDTIAEGLLQYGTLSAEHINTLLNQCDEKSKSVK